MAGISVMRLAFRVRIRVRGRGGGGPGDEPARAGERGGAADEQDRRRSPSAPVGDAEVLLGEGAVDRRAVRSGGLADQVHADAVLVGPEAGDGLGRRCAAEQRARRRRPAARGRLPVLPAHRPPGARVARARGVAGGHDAGHAGHAAGPDGHAVGGQAGAGQPAGVGDGADGHEDDVGAQAPPVVQLDGLHAAATVDPGDPGPDVDRDAAAPVHAGEPRAGGLTERPGEGSWGRLHDRDLGAEGAAVEATSRPTNPPPTTSRRAPGASRSRSASASGRFRRS